MSYTYKILIANKDKVRVEQHGPGNTLIGEPSGKFFSENLSDIQMLADKAGDGKLKTPDEFGELLFNTLFDDKLKTDFSVFCNKAISEKAILRIELDIDENQLPEIAAIPWEFISVPPDSAQGKTRIAAAPDMVFSRWRSQSAVPNPISLSAGENLRIALAIAAPEDLGIVKYQEIHDALKKLCETERIELLPLVNPANRIEIDQILKQKPHIFHFIGHGRLKKTKKGKEYGELALVDATGSAEWISDENFSELFTGNHKPGIVLLQACESGARSSSQAFTGVASRIVQQNIPVVVAMQYKISNLAAKLFSTEFYKRLANNDPADKAAQQGRRRLSLEWTDKPDFATPVIFMRVRDGNVFQREIPAPSEIPGLIEQSHQHEQKSAYDQAIKKWRIIQQIDSEHPDAVSEIERLTKLIEQNETFKKINQELLRRMKDILPIFKPVAAYVKRMAKEGISEDGEIFLNVMNQFLENNISGQEFIELWKQFESKPSSAGNAPNYDILTKRLMRGEIIPVLGTEALQLSQIAQKMAEKISYDDFAGTLSMISQYYQYEGHSRGMLIETVKTLMEQENLACVFNPIYSLLKKIEKPFILISSSYDSLWECIFQNTAKKYAVLSPSNQEPGKILLKYNDKPEELKTPENISGLLEDGYSLIYKICGCFGLDQKDDTLMISETDFFAVSKRLEKLIPEYLIRQFSGKSFLFLGYDLEQWHDRLIAHSILEKANRRDRSFAVRENPTPYQRAFWKSNHVDIYDVELQEFIGKLNV
jgi:hypothetical protein